MIHVQYDHTARQDQLLRVLDPLQVLLDAEVAAIGSGPGQRFRESHAALRRRMGRPFNLVVVGEFKRGKSTLVNALLGEEIVSSDVTPETVVVQEIHHGDSLTARAILEDGGHVTLDASALRSEDLAKLADQVPSPIHHLHITAPSAFLDGLVMTDTPGTGDLLARFDATIQAYLPQADAVIYTVSALSPLSESERSFLQLTLGPMQLSKVCFVVNMADNLPDEDAVDRVQARIDQQVKQHFPDSPTIAVSALDELMKALDEGPAVPDRSEALSARFETLRAHLAESVLLNKDGVRLAHGIRDAEVAVQGVRGDLAALAASLDTDVAELESKRDELRAGEGELAERLAAMLTELDAVADAGRERGATWLVGFVDRLMAEVLPTLDGMEHETVQKHLPFFLNDRLRTAFQAVMETQKAALIDALQTAELASAPADVSQASADAAFHPPQLTGTTQILVALGVAGRFLVIPSTLLRAVVGVADKTGGDEQRAIQYREHLTAALPELREALVQAHSEATGDLVKAARDALVAANEGERSRWLSASEDALAAHGRGATHLGRTRASVGRLIGQTDQVLPRIQGLKIG
ncbi:MAG: hypothetical protein GY913_30250 [Proteobacteria bacterium]|nr:hypothetical protein [Pseudomonadota bacterium]MCP4921200.1 hypothetical protein [Pseudomonadota bacterium]